MLNTGNMRDKDVLAGQYQDRSNLDLRRNFHKKYGSSPTRYTDWILAKIRFFKGCRVLEVGCGTGNLWEHAAELVETFSELVLSDISEGMLESARKSYEGRQNIKIQRMDVLELPFEDNSFDIVIANSMLYHVNALDAALENVRRVLREGGALHATTFGRDGLINYINAAMFEMGLSASEKVEGLSFTLENGADILRKHFLTVRMEPYRADLAVSQPADLVDYIFSMASMSHVDRSNRERMNAYFESKKDGQGLLRIQQTYGMFIALK